MQNHGHTEETPSRGTATSLADPGHLFMGLGQDASPSSLRAGFTGCQGSISLKSVHWFLKLEPTKLTPCQSNSNGNQSSHALLE